MHGKVSRQLGQAIIWCAQHPGEILQVTSPTKQASDQARARVQEMVGSVPENMTFFSTDGPEPRGSIGSLI